MLTDSRDTLCLRDRPDESEDRLRRRGRFTALLLLVRVCLDVPRRLINSIVLFVSQFVIYSVLLSFIFYSILCHIAGFQLYVMLIEVFEAEKSRLRWYYLVAYGAPLLVVAISCIIDPLSYGTDRYCWLRADNYFIFSFVGPVILVILVIS